MIKWENTIKSSDTHTHTHSMTIQRGLHCMGKEIIYWPAIDNKCFILSTLSKTRD